VATPATHLAHRKYVISKGRLHEKGGGQREDRGRKKGSKGTGVLKQKMKGKTKIL
jgi:hypothetical protein